MKKAHDHQPRGGSGPAIWCAHDRCGGYRDDDYLPEDGILVVRDSGTGFGEDEMSAIDAHPCGTIVRTGQGWLYASGGDGPFVVRLQVHSDQPGDEDLHLGEPGLYRLRVAHRPLSRRTVE